jgi:hypothetical protein
MFEVTGSEIASLTDVDLRTLVARLALAELREAGLPQSSVTAGGNQTAPDGGLDVRVSVPGAIASPNFVPRPETGFQVKKSDMNASSIMEEMKPKGELRTIFGELADKDGAYVIVSAQGSVADKPLQDRKKAMRDALSGMKDAERLLVDFYDRDRVANWTNSFPGVAAWVRDRVGRRLSGWSAIGEWAGTRASEADDYLSGGKTCVVDERTKEREELSLLDGISRIRKSLSQPAACVRLIGLSGVGKTRLVHALFEDGVGADPLDPGIAIYTDYSDSIDPTARDMARQLVGAGKRAFLIVDNCNPATHSELAKICSASGSQVSLLSVEYDVRDDEPEHTEVFRLQTVSPEVVGTWIAKTFPAISQVDRDRIADFSDGNFRVARALAETLRKGETLGQLKSRDLFNRIFEQRTGSDTNLMQGAEDLSLVYSYDGEDTSADSELARIAAIRGVTTQQLFRATAELKQRGIVQTRGRWCALLPLAISNRLAAFALERISASDFDAFRNTLSPRMLRSLSRRLGYLHNSQEARATVGRWLGLGGPLADLMALDGNGITILRNLAPVAPHAVLMKIRNAAGGSNADALIGMSAPNRSDLIGLVKALAFEPEMFDDAALTLVKFACAEPADNNNHPGRDSFKELFHLYISGTQALIDQRITLARRLAKSSDSGEQQCGLLAFEGLLKAEHFISMHSFDFGARSRDYGWQPRTHEDTQNWFTKAIDLAVELKNIPGARANFAGHIRSLWWLSGCQDELDATATAFSNGRAWIDGWLNFRATLRFNGKGTPAKIREQLERIIDRLKPADLVDRARALVLEWSSTGYDIVDGDEDDDEDDASGSKFQRAYQRALEAAVDIGKAVASSPSDLHILLPEISSARQQRRAYQFGRGLAQGSLDLGEMWSALKAAYTAAATEHRNPTMMGGFLNEAHARDPDFVALALDAAIDEPSVAPSLPFLQARVGIDEAGITRLRTAIAKAALSSNDFWSIADGSIEGTTPSDLTGLLGDIAGLPGGVAVAIEMLHMYLFSHRNDQNPTAPELIEIGRNMLLRLDFNEHARRWGLLVIAQQCLAGFDAEEITRKICQNIRSTLDTGKVSSHVISQLLEGLFDAQPVIALTEFLLGGDADSSVLPIWLRFGDRMPIEKIAPDVLTAWADQDPDSRYNLLSETIGIFTKEHGEEQHQLSPLFLALLDRAPNKSAFLGDCHSRLQPKGWGASLADVLVKRWEVIRQLGEHRDNSVRQWVTDMEAPVAGWIEAERQRDRRREESFE